MYAYINIHMYIDICLCIYPSIDFPSMYLSIYLTMHLAIYLTIYLSTYLALNQIFYLWYVNDPSPGDGLREWKCGEGL